MEKEEQIRRLCEERAREIYGKCLPRRIAGRIDKEMEFVHKKDAADVFLQLSELFDIRSHGKKNQYERGFRGVAGSSFLAYLCGLDAFNPMETGDFALYPEMFFGAVEPEDCDDRPLHFDVNLTRTATESLQGCMFGKRMQGIKLYDTNQNLNFLETYRTATKDIYRMDVVTARQMDIRKFFTDETTELLPMVGGSEIARQIFEMEQDMDFELFVKWIGLEHGGGTWHDNAQYCHWNGYTVKQAISCVEDVYECLLEHKIPAKEAYQITERVRKGTTNLSESDRITMKEAGISDWFIESCGKIKYLFYRSQNICYALEYCRLLYYVTRYGNIVM